MAAPLVGLGVGLAGNAIRLTGGALLRGAGGAGARNVGAAAAAAVPAAAPVANLATQAIRQALLIGGLLGLLNWLNQSQQQNPLSPEDGNTATWPTNKPGQVVTYSWVWVSHGYFDPVFRERVYRTSTAIPSATPGDPNAFYEGFGLTSISWGGSSPGTTNGGQPGYLRLLSSTTSDGLAPATPTAPSGYAPSRTPLVDFLGAPLRVAPPADPMAPAVPSPAPSPTERPKAPPIPGTPAPAPGRLAPVPRGTPGRSAPQPGSVPGSSPIGDPLKAPAPATMPNRDPLRQPVTTTSQGTLPQPAAQPAPITKPGSTFLRGGIELQEMGPRPTTQEMAKELGKLEQKLEILLAPEPPMSLLSQINRVIDQIENIKFVLDNLFPPGPYQFGAGAYGLQPVCDRNAEGALLPPMLAQWPAGEGEVVEVNRKLDALATLIQFHKELKQPTCGGSRGGAASNVTVHFESD